MHTAAAALLLALAACGGGASTSQAGIAQGAGAMESADRRAGSEVFAANCAVCHGATGVEGGTLGPSLRHESERMSFGATASWIEDPQPPMPHLYPKVLTGEEVRDVAAYVDSL